MIWLPVEFLYLDVLDVLLEFLALHVLVVFAMLYLDDALALPVLLDSDDRVVLG